VQFYFLVENAEEILDAYALVSHYASPDADMLEDSHHTLCIRKRGIYLNTLDTLKST